MAHPLIAIPFILQGLLMFFDEFYFHQKRGLPKWERIGHPLDTLTVLACFSYLAFAPVVNPTVYVALAAFSCLFVTKDEFIHREECDATETWLHSVLFVLHPVVLFCAYQIYQNQTLQTLFYVQFTLASLMLVFQIVYWNFFNQRNVEIDNEIYDQLGDRWYTAYDDPVALLRSESKVKVPWVKEKINQHFTNLSEVKLLDVGCGAGFLTNALAESNIQVTGMDLSKESLTIAKKHDSSCSVHYTEGNAYHLPFETHSFDVITCMDFLEHVDRPEAVVKEIARVLKPGGLFFYHTFNRNFLSYLVIIKLVEWLVKNTPKHMHIIKLFIKPKELNQYCMKNGLKTQEMTGIRPIFSTIRIASLFRRIVPETFSFKLTNSLALSYMGVAQKN